MITSNVTSWSWISECIPTYAPGKDARVSVSGPKLADLAICMLSPSPSITIEEEPESPSEDGVRTVAESLLITKLTILVQTVKRKEGDTLRPPPSSQSRASGRSFGRGDLDQAIRSMRTGRRRDRNPASRPLSKIFVDGTRSSRIFDP